MDNDTPAAASSTPSWPAMERLRNRIESAARELERLREENRLLADRIAELEANPFQEHEGTLAAFDDDPEALRQKVEGFIGAIDRYLGKEN